MTNPALVFDPSGLSQRGLTGGEWRQLKQYSFLPPSGSVPPEIKYLALFGKMYRLKTI